jgi:putative ABC transport system permease protein
VFQDLRYGLRMLLKHPAFTIIAIFTLALGIGVNSALFTVYDAFVLKPLPLKDPYSIANLTGYDRDGKRSQFFSYLDYVDYRDRSTTFVGLIAWTRFAAPFDPDAADARDATAAPADLGVGHLVSGNYFAVLGAEMALGRGFAPEEDRAPRTHPVLVLSHTCWTRHFNSDPNIVGKSVRLAGLRFTIVGVTAPGFIGVTPDAPQFWAPLMMRDQLVGSGDQRQWLTDRKADLFALIGRLKPGVSHAQAEAETRVIAEQLARDYPDPQRKASVGVSSGATFIQLDDRVKPLVAPLLTAVGLVFLIACVNVTNMLLARAAGRQREIAVRLALGASRARLVRQLLNESVLLAALGGAAGFLMAVWAIHLIYPLVLAQLPVPPALLEQFALDLSPDYRVFLVALFVSLVAGVGAGLAPALQSSRPNLSAALKNEGSTFGAHLSQSRLRNALVVTQIAVCLTLLIAAGLLTRNLQKLRTIETGLVTKNVFTLNISAQYATRDSKQLNDIYSQISERLRALPGVRRVARMQRPPFTGTQTTQITIPEQEQLADHSLQANYNFVSASYFETLGLRITRGRSFTENEEQANGHVVVVSESTARRFWPDQDPLGKHIGIAVAAEQTSTDNTSTFASFEVIGLANDTRQGVVFRPDETYLYLPLPEAAAKPRSSGDNLIVSTEGDARGVMTAAYNEAGAIDPKLFVLLGLVDDSLAAQMIPFQDIALLAGALGMLALALASIGLYGVMSFIVTQRTREIGVRMALGAQRGNVITLFLRHGGKLITIGVTIGLAGGSAISRLLGAALTDINQFDPLTFVVVAAFLTVVALSACYVPARRATTVDPMAALRHD